MKVKSFALSDIGKVRGTNQDYFVVKEEDSKEVLKYGKAYLVCDGMGGHKGGEIASKIVCEEFINSYYSESLLEENIQNRIKISLEIANKRIFEYANNDSSLLGMGTTVVGLILKDRAAFVFNVGDSRCYMINENEIEQLTEDHSYVNELVKAKLISKEEARKSDKKNILTRVVGVSEKVTPFVRRVDINSNIKFLLCSDGLWNLVRDVEIKHILLENELKEAVVNLISLANERGGNDNITVIAVEVSGIVLRRFRFFRLFLILWFSIFLFGRGFLNF